MTIRNNKMTEWQEEVIKVAMEERIAKLTQRLGVLCIDVAAQNPDAFLSGIYERPGALVGGIYRNITREIDYLNKFFYNLKVV